MAHMDEEIIKTKRRMIQAQKDAWSDENVEKELEASIYDEDYRLFGMKLECSERILPELKLGIYMPTAFYQLTSEFAGMLYPMGNRPSHVFGGEDIPFQMALSRTEHMVPDDGLEKFMPMIKKVMENMGPKTRILGTGVIEKDGRHLGLMEFVSRAVDLNVYNVMYFFSMDDRLMIGTVNFPAKYQKRMVKTAKELIDSLRFIEEEG